MHRVTLAILGLAALTIAYADTLTLRSGKTVRGTYLGGSSRQVRMEVGDRIESFDVADVSSIQFTSESAAASPSAPATDAPRVFRPAQPAPRAASRVEIPQGTQVTIRMIDAIDSEKNQLGQTFAASVDEPIVVEGSTVVPRGADVVVKLVEDKQSGKLSGRTELGLALQSITVNGRVLDVTTDEVTQASESRGARTGKVVGGAAAVGAIIGGIAGGGKGAAIGAVTGAGAGTAVQVATKGQRVRIPSETRLTFTLAQAVRQ